MGRQREFSNEKNRVDRRVQYYKCRTRKLFIQNMSAYLDWITQAGIVCMADISYKTVNYTSQPHFYCKYFDIEF